MAKICKEMRSIINLYLSFLAVEYWDNLHKLSNVQKTGICIIFLGLCYIGKAEDIVEHQKYRVTLKSYAVLLFILIVALHVLYGYDAMCVCTIL